MAILNHGSTIRTADGGQSTTTIVTASNIGTYGVAANSAYYIGTTQNVFNRASGAQTLTGVSIDGNAANITAYTINQNVGTSNTPSFAGIVSSAITNYAYLQVTDVNNFWITPGNANWGLYFETSAGGLLGGSGDSNRLGFVGAGAARFYVDLNNGNGWFGGSLTANTDSRAPIFYDSNDTAYYVDPNSVSRLASLRIYSAFDTASSDVYANMRVMRNNATTDGMYIGYGNSGSTSALTRIFGGGATTGELSKYSTYTLEPGSFRSPIFYDSDNTGYYLDAASTSNLNILGVAGRAGIGGAGSRSTNGLTVGFTDNSTFAANTDVGDTDRMLSIVNESSTTNAMAVLGFRVNPNGGTANAMLDIKYVQTGATNTSGLHYTFNHGGSFLDRFSILSSGNVGIGAIAPDTNLQVVGHVHVGNQTTFENTGGWNKTIYLDGTYHARVRVIGSAYASGKNSQTETYLWVDNTVSPYSGLATNAGSFQISAGFTTMLNSARSPLFYDSDNTAYYCDPNSTSNLYYIQMPYIANGSANILVNNGGSENWNAIKISGGNDQNGIGYSNTSHSAFGRNNFSFHTHNLDSIRFHSSGWDTLFEVAGSSGNAWLKGGSFDSSFTRLVNPGGAYYVTGTSTITGAIKIRLPRLNANTMMRMTVKIYQYNTGQCATIECGGYDYSGDGIWRNIFAYQNSDLFATVNVRFGNDGTYDCVWIGETSSTWSYPQVFVTDFQAGYSNYTSDWGTGWNISFVTTFNTVTDTRVAYKTLNAGNYNSYAPTLTGTGASGTWSINVTGNAATVTNGVYTTGDQTISGIKYFTSTVDPSTVPAGYAGGYILESTTGFGTYGIIFGSATGQHGAIGYSSNTMYFGTENGTDNTLNTKATLSSGGTFTANGDVRSPIFYDSANTAYYIDPASNSRVSQITTDTGTGIYLGAQNVSTSSRIIINWHSDADYNYLIGKRAGAWTQPMDISFYTGIRYHAHQSYNAHIFYVTGYDSGEAFSIGKGDGHVRVVNNLYAPIIYDSNNTGYYCDPASNSVLNGLYVNAYYNLSNDYKDIYVYGDVNTYYVVLIEGNYQYSFGRYSVTRGYNWTGPDTWYTASHKGGLTLDWEWSGDTAWGGNDKAIRIIEFNESYSTMVAGLGYPVNGGVIIWLRGGGVGGAQYRIRTPIGSNATVTAYDGVSATNHSTLTTFTAADSSVFTTRANTNNVSAEILARYPVRSAASLYNDNNLVVDIGSGTQTKSGIFASAASVRAPIFYDTDNTAYYIDAVNTSNLLGLTVVNTITGNITGNAGTATILQTARNINGTSFNGSAAITTASWGTARTLTIGSTGKSVDGSAAVAWSLAEIGAAAIAQTMFIGTTSVAINRASAGQTLTGISIDGNSGGIYAAGQAFIQTTSSGTSYVQHIQVREAAGGGGLTSEIYAPALGFHWSGVVASNILMESSGRMSIRNNPGTSYENFIANIVYGNSSVQTPILYDSNNTAYYLDPANSGTSLLVAGKVGLGTTSAISMLDVRGAHASGYGIINVVSTDSALIALDSTGARDHGIRLKYNGVDKWLVGMRDTNESYSFSNSSDTRLVTILQGGNVGVGTTSPSGKLHVYNSAAADTYLESGTSGTTGKLIFKTSDNADLNKYIMQESFYMILNGHANEGFKFRDSNGNVLLSIFGAANAYASRVGIGTQTPAQKLHVSGIGYSDTDFRAPTFYDSNNTAYYIDAASTSNLLGLTVANTITGSISGNAGTAYGLNVHTGRNNEVNKVVRTDGSGYIQAGWINTDSGDSGFATRLTRITCSTDNYLRYLGLTDFKVSIGESAKNNYSRRVDYSSDPNYHVGSFGHNGYGANETFHGGSGFIDIWAGTNYPSGLTHIHGFNALHYTTNSLGTTGGTAYGWQMVAQYNTDSGPWWRRCSGGSFGSWFKLVSYGNNQSGDIYAQRYYDNDNTVYYTDPASTSNLLGLTVVNTITGSITGNAGGSSASCTGNSATTTLATKATRANGNFYIDDNYGNTVVGAYNAARYQGVYAMGDSYKLAADGTTTGTLYGIAWSHPNAGGAAGNLSDHGALILINGGYVAAISSSIRCTVDMRTPIYYDSNDTTYYTDPASFSLISSMGIGGLTSSSNTQMFDSYVDASSSYQQAPPLIIRKDSSATGAIDQAPVGLFIYNLNGTNNTWTKLSMGSREAAGAGNTVSIAGLAAQKIAGTSGSWATGNLHFWTKSGATQITNMIAYSSGYVESAYSFRAPIFYDSNNTAYYVDPSSTSNLVGLTVTNTITGSITGNAGGSSASCTGNAATVTNGIYTTSYYTGTPLGKRRYRIHSADSTSLNSSISSLECGFTYGGSGEPTGPFIAFGGLSGAIDYSCQLVGAYSGGGNDFKIRTRNDDAATWNTWRTIVTDGNYTDYTVTKTGTGASGTWGINITGNAGGSSASCTGNAATVTNGVYTNASQDFTGINTIYNSNNTVINTLSGNLGLTMYQATAGTDAYMTFHIGGDYAAYFGLGGAENDLVYGGWSAGNNRHRILHSGNATYAWNMNQYVRTTDNPGFNSVLIASEISISKNNARNLQIQGSGGADSGLLGRGSSGQFAFQVYGSGGGDYGFLNGAWLGWDIKKTVSGNLYLNANDTYYLNPASTTNLLSLTVANTITGSISGNAGTATGQQSGGHFTINTGGAGYGLVGQYNPDVHQGLFAMGGAYTLGTNGTLGNLYGVSWSYDYSGRQLNTGYNLQHCLAIANAGIVYTVIGQGIWTNGLIRANGAISSGGTITAATFSGAGTSLTGTAASLNIGGGATYLNSSNYINRVGSTTNYNTDFQNTPAGSVRHQGDDATATNNPGGAWWFLDNYRHSNGSNYWGTQVAWGWEDNANRLATRNVTGGVFGAWVYYLNSSNASYAFAMNQNVGTGDSPTFTNLSVINSAGRLITYSSGAFAIQRNVITTGGSLPVLSLINTQGITDGRGASIQLDLGYGGSSSVIGTAARGARIAALAETTYDATAANQNAALVFYTSAAGSLTEKMRIQSSGNVGIGTISPTQKLEVNGTIKATSFVGSLSRTSTTQTITGNSALTIDVSAAYIHVITVVASGGVFGISSVTYNNRKAGPEVDEIILIFKWPASGGGSTNISNTIGDIPFNYGKATVTRLTSYKGTSGLWIAETVASNIDYTNL